jgi:hypothetical protein
MRHATLAPWVPFVGSSVRAWLRWAAHHTGLPMIVVAAIALVVSWRLFRRATRFALEVTVVLVLLACATRIGWITW